MYFTARFAAYAQCSLCVLIHGGAQRRRASARRHRAPTGADQSDAVIEGSVLNHRVGECIETPLVIGEYMCVYFRACVPADAWVVFSVHLYGHVSVHAFQNSFCITCARYSMHVDVRVCLCVYVTAHFDYARDFPGVLMFLHIYMCIYAQINECVYMCI